VRSLWAALVAIALLLFLALPGAINGTVWTTVCRVVSQAGAVPAACLPPAASVRSANATDRVATIADSVRATVSPAPVTGACSPANYTGVVNTAPQPANFCAYTVLPFRNFVGPTPAATDAANSSIIQTYATNTGAGDEYFTSYATNTVDGTGIGGFPVWVGKSTDPHVYVNCAASSVQYGCSIGTGTNGSSGTTTTSTAYGPFDIPAAARPGSTDSTNSGDENLTVLQPNGIAVNLYFTGCNTWSNWTSSSVVGGNVCVGSFVGASFSDVQTNNGANPGNIDGGDDFMALIPHYNEVVPAGATINHALELRVSCLTGTVRFPAASSSLSCAAGTNGIPSGSHLHLRLTHAQIDALGLPDYTYMKPFYYALSDYGGFIVDTSGPNNVLRFVGPFSIEDSSPWLRTGNTSPWIAWFNAQGAPSYNNAGGTYFLMTDNFFAPIASYLEILDPCHDIGTC
jgi:hypothetical protein